jgi:hypothetical protein
MPTIIETMVYTIDELITEFGQDSKPVKKAMEWGSQVASEWWDGREMYDDAKAIAKILGITVERFYYSGFCSQGDGACFEGTYDYAKGSKAAIRAYAGQDKELHRIADELQALQKQYFYRLGAHVKHSGHYYHEMCTRITVTHTEEYYEGDWAADHADDEDALKELLRDFMRWFYKQLEEDYWYAVSEESVLDNLRANEYTFTEDGERF